MKLIAKRDFANVPALRLQLTGETPGFVHENIVHKGHRFEIGTAPEFKNLHPSEKEVVTQLIASHAAILDIAPNQAAIAVIVAEVAAEAKRAAAAAAKKG
jgi:hypothetical protein